MADVTLVKAVNMALARAMDEDDDVLVLGQDVGANGGVFRATEGLLERFGERRVRDTPLAELLICGASIGMAAQGTASRVRDPVRGVHLPGSRPAREPRVEAAHPHPGAHDLPPGPAHPRRRRHPCTGTPLGEHRGVSRPRARAQVRDPVDAGARVRTAALGHSGPGSGRVPGADAALPARQGSGGGRRTRPSRSAAPSWSAAAPTPP